MNIHTQGQLNSNISPVRSIQKQRWYMNIQKRKVTPITRYPVQRIQSYTKNTRNSQAVLSKVHFTGRLATYKYYNMDQVVAQSLKLFKNIISKTESEQHINGHKVPLLQT